MRGFCTLLLHVLLPALLPAQELRFSFKHLTTSQGLASNQINAIAQDSQGYIWIGTSNGLQRYDGIRFRNFKHNPEAERTIPSNVVAQLHFGGGNRLWLLSGEGEAGIFDTRKLAFQKADIYENDKKLERLPGTRFLSDEWGNVFLLNNKGGLYLWNEQKGAFHAFAFPTPAAKGWRPTGLAPLPGTPDYILSFGARGLFLFQTHKGVWNGGQATLKPLRLPGYPEGIEAYNLLADQKGRLWAQAWPGPTPEIYCYGLAGKRWLIRSYQPAGLVGGYVETAPFFESRNGEVWVYGADMFARHNEATGTFHLVHNGYDSGRPVFYRVINTLFEDRENTIWVGTNDNGIFAFNPGREYFRNISHIHRRTNRRGRGSPLGFIQLADSTVLVSVWGDGLYRYGPQWDELPFEYKGDPELKNYSIWSMCPSRQEGVIWMASQAGRIIRYSQQANRMEAYGAAPLDGRTIRQVVEDRRGDLWLGMHGTGVYHWKCDRAGRPAAESIAKFADIPDCRVSKMVIDAKGLLWVATETEGLYAIDPDARRTALHFSDTNPDPARRLANAGVSSVLEYNDSLVLISGWSSLQAYNRNRKTLTRIKTEEALAGYIAGLALDRPGNLWVSTTSGLCRANLQTSTWLKFGRRDGIDDENFVLASSCTLPDGRMLFGASESFVVFDPAVFNKIENARPEATLTGLQANNRMVPVDSLEEAGGLRLRHYETALAMEFSTLEFHRSNSIRYKMEGLDPDWQSNENNIAVYAYLPAGSYRFLLQPIYADGTPGPIRSLNITRTPPFWQAWWFYSLICLAGGGILYLFDRERIRRRKALQEMRAKIADQLHEQVRTALNSIHILSEMAAIKGRKDPPRAAGYVEQINSKAQQMMQAMDDMLWAVAPENDSMAKAVERIEAYVHKLHSGGHAAIGLLVGPEVSGLAFDMQFRQMLLRLVKESVNSLLRAGARNLHVYLGREKMQLSYVAEFDKAEVDMTVLNNFLQSGEMVNLLSDMGATPQVEIHQSKGALSFSVPF